MNHKKVYGQNILNHSLQITYKALWANNNIILEDFTNLEAEFDNREVPTPTKTPKTHNIKCGALICRYCKGKPMHTS